MSQHLGLRLLQASLNMRRQLNRLAEFGSLTQGEYLVLRHMWLAERAVENAGREGTIKAAELSEQLERPRPAITRILNDLEARGLITRSIDPKDRRSVRIDLTAAGAAELNQANDTILRMANRIVAALGEPDTERLIQLLNRLAQVYTEILGEEGRNGDG